MEAEPRARTGQERFYHKYPYLKNKQEFEHLGIGAMTISPERIMTKELIDQLFLEDMRDY